MISRPDFHIPKRFQGLSAWVALLLVIASTVTGLATFVLLTGLTPFRPSEEMSTALRYCNMVLLALMAAVVLFQLGGLFWAKHKGVPGTGLHIRLISLFSLIAALPAILVALFAIVTLDRGLDTWFSERTRAIVDTASTVAEAYLTNATEATRQDLANISTDLVQQIELFKNDRPTFLRRAARHAAIRNLAAIYVFDTTTKKIEVNVAASDQIKFIAPPQDAIELANKGEIAILNPGKGGNLVRALIKLQGYPNHYLYIYRIISPVVVQQLVTTREAKTEYDQLMKQRSGVQSTFALVYALLTLGLLLSAIWAGMRFSDRLVAPLVRLLNASRQVADGNFEAKVSTLDGPGDLITLSRSFNMMTDQIRMHRDELVTTNEQLDDRRRFIEAVLSGVSAGVIGIDETQTISLVNRQALSLLHKNSEQVLKHFLTDVQSEFAELFELAQSRPSGAAEGQVDTQIAGRDVSFIVRITIEKSDELAHGYVLTFDDITDLVSAQRNSAWADIARRIAHEIKNPLTPIQLSAERLKRKYLKEIKTDKHVFEQCTDTIIRQVGDLGRIVDEFSSFARMPKAVPEMNSLIDTIRDATVLQRVSSSDIEFALNLPEDEIKFPFDRRLITQAVTNLVKNAREAIEARVGDSPTISGLISVTAGIDNGAPFIAVTDNGVGLPNENRHRLAEPYMTTREKGTGLGLAIVKRIMEEHGGALRLTDAPSGQGASVTLSFAQIEELIPA